MEIGRGGITEYCSSSCSRSSFVCECVLLLLLLLFFLFFLILFLVSSSFFLFFFFFSLSFLFSCLPHVHPNHRLLKWAALALTCKWPCRRYYTCPPSRPSSRPLPSQYITSCAYFSSLPPSLLSSLPPSLLPSFPLSFPPSLPDQPSP